MQQLTQKIKEVLDEQGRSQKWLTKHINKSYYMVSVDVQNRQQPRLETLNKIADTLDVDVRQLIISNKEN